MKDIYNALATAHKSLTDTHKRNLKEMLVKFCIRKLSKHRIQNAIHTNKYVHFEDDYEENNSVQEVPNIELTIDDTQEFSEPTEIEIVEPIEVVEQEENTEFTQEEIAEIMQEEYEKENEKTIYYSQWLNEYKGNGWKMVEGSYDKVAKTVKVVKG
jgi:hypothetical protein